MATLHRNVLCMFFMLCLIHTASAINFGSTTKGDYMEVENNNTASFTLIFWSSDNENHLIKITVAENPSDIPVYIENETLEIGGYSGNEMIYSSSGYVRASTTNVFMKNIPRGFHNVLISAKTAGSGTGITVSQERIFNLIIKSGETENNLGDKPSDVVSAEKNYTYVYALAIFTVLIISLAIYKYS